MPLLTPREPSTWFPGEGLRKGKAPSMTSLGVSRRFISLHKRVNPVAHIPQQRWIGLPQPLLRGLLTIDSGGLPQTPRVRTAQAARDESLFPRHHGLCEATPFPVVLLGYQEL